LVILGGFFEWREVAGCARAKFQGNVFDQTNAQLEIVENS